MIKSFFPSLFVMCFVSSCSHSFSDLDQVGLKGNVKSITEHQYKARFENGRWVAGDPSFNGHRITKYDKKGLYIKTIALTEYGDTIGYTRCKRKNGELVEETFISTIENRITRTIMERVSDEQVNFEVWEENRLYYEGANYFDSRGRISRQVRVVNNTELVNYYVYEKDLLVKNYQEDYRGNRTVNQQYEYQEFDNKENWTRKLIYVGKEKIVPDLVVTRDIEYYR